MELVPPGTKKKKKKKFPKSHRAPYPALCSPLDQRGRPVPKYSAGSWGAGPKAPAASLSPTRERNKPVLRAAALSTLCLPGLEGEKG